MINIDRILTGIDLGPDTEKVLAYASFFGKLFGAQVHLLYVIDYLVTPPAYIMPYLEQERVSALDTLNQWQNKLNSMSVEARSEVIIGRLYESFDLSLKRLMVDFLVLGYRSHPLRRSSSEKLIKGLDVPMLVVRGEKTRDMKIGDVRIGSIICPVDFSEHSKKALTFASSLSGLTESRIHILHVLQAHLLKEKGKEGIKAIEEMTEEARERIKGLSKELNTPSMEGHVIIGEPFREILSFSRQKDADLIIIGARGLGLIQGMLLGSVTDAVLRSSPCPVLVIH